MIRTSQSFCRINETHGRARYELIIIVKSSPTNAARRTIAPLGLPPDTVNRSRLLDALSNEATRFDDIILTNFTDSYYNVTLKALLNLRFAHVACGAATPLFVFMDDDHGLNLTALLHYFHRFDEEKGHRDQLQRSIFGHIHKRPKVIRAAGDKWAVTRSEMPFNLYPDYAAGPCYFIGAEAVASLSIATALT
ncbi:unnamed protein product [Dibothriocephalus latus]|uniref:Hexosyltransferase n=1 Tax=Dibothriocephalus latus TaxID=60516 RepID=A0A3P7LAC6_DIBLA|nr:unnamed protein product [Dibothriocephalus latus]